MNIYPADRPSKMQELPQSQLAASHRTAGCLRPCVRMQADCASSAKKCPVCRDSLERAAKTATVDCVAELVRQWKQVGLGFRVESCMGVPVPEPRIAVANTGVPCFPETTAKMGGT